MKLTYRGQNYEANTAHPDTVVTDVTVKYRGVEYKLRDLLPAKVWTLF
ncbi:DUF4278 domain-containing protein [Synechococcus sp. PCC 6312]|nr:hypothetical protein Syn6312_0676 [Synechococcus sp. PCC 6312]